MVKVRSSNAMWGIKRSTETFILYLRKKKSDKSILPEVQLKLKREHERSQNRVIHIPFCDERMVKMILKMDSPFQ